jgi:hypothetical protein
MYHDDVVFLLPCSYDAGNQLQQKKLAGAFDSQAIAAVVGSNKHAGFYVLYL